MVLKTITPELINEAFLSLNEREQKIAFSLHELCDAYNLKIEMRKTSNLYAISYVARKPRKVLFTQKINFISKEYNVKANLMNIDAYLGIVEKCSVNLKNLIKATKNCTRCNIKCYPTKKNYTLDGVFYDPCITAAHNFHSLGLMEWDDLKELIILEYKVHSGIYEKDTDRSSGNI